MAIKNVVTPPPVRQRAEDDIAGIVLNESKKLTLHQAKHLLHELRIHQAELEIQNEELRRIQNKLEASQERYISLYDHAPIGYLTLNGQGLILEANLTVAAMLGTTRAELLNKRMSSFILPEDQDTYYLNQKTHNETNEPNHLEIRVIRTDKSFFWASLQIVNINSNEQRISLLDADKRKLADELLRSTVLYTRTLIETSLDPLVTINSAGRITDVNHATVKTTGVSREQLIGTDFSSYFSDPEKARGAYLKAFSEGTVYNYPLSIRHISGTTTEVLYNASVYQDRQGEIQGVFAAARDVTERNKIVEALRHAHDNLEKQVTKRTLELSQANEQMKKVAFELVWAEERERERIAGELHDRVGQSLLLAKMKLEVLANELPSPAHRMSADTICSLLGESIKDIRSLTFRVRPPLLNTADLETALKWLSTSFADDYHLKVEFSNNNVRDLLSEEYRYTLFYAIRELLLNVVKHAKTDTAKLTMRNANNMLAVQVTDDGIGFEPQSEIMKHFAGGYGLYNVRQRLEQLDGHFTVDSAPGRGTTVTLLVPNGDES